jgi:hypothetical protein
VETALQRCQFYPSLAQMLEFASEWGGTALAALPEDTRTVAEKREDFRRGFEAFRSKLQELVGDVDALASGKAMK